ncbi:Respiratory chain complex assembly or maintenance protein [Coemansia erecta]|nr:Respiratory chain complex assembly or maintenance protein [Coemansia erecta]
MHPALADHINPGCVDLVERLMTCHTENSWAKFFGKCNALSEALNRCLGEEFEIRRRKQLVEARARRSKVEERWAEQREDDRQHEEFERLQQQQQQWQQKREAAADS